MDRVVSSHDYGVEKEQGAFWQQLVDEHEVQPSRSLLIEDSLAVLGAAKQFGIAHAIAISRPDTSQARRVIEEFTEVEGVASLID